MMSIKKMATVMSISLLSSLASAVPSLSFDPTPALGDVGDAINVDLVWDGDGANYIGAWDVDITFDSSVVSYVGTSFGTGLNSLGCVVPVDCDALEGGGVIDAFEFSFDSVAFLTANQDASGNRFTLATFEFTGLMEGVSDLSLLINDIGDENGGAFSMPVTSSNGKICVGGGGCPAAVPEPPAILLMALGLAGLLVRRCSKN